MFFDGIIAGGRFTQSRRPTLPVMALGIVAYAGGRRTLSTPPPLNSTEFNRWSHSRTYASLKPGRLT